MLQALGADLFQFLRLGKVNLMPAIIHARSNPAVASLHLGASGVQESIEALNPAAPSLPAKPLTSEERATALLRQHFNRMTAVPDLSRLSLADTDDVESVSSPSAFSLNAIMMQNNPGIKGLQVMQGRAKDYFQRQVESLPPSYLSSMEWLPNHLRQYLDYRPAQVAQQMPSRFMSFIDGSATLSIEDPKSFMALSQAASTCRSADPMLNELTHAPMLWMENQSKTLLAFNSESFKGFEIKQEAAEAFVRHLKGNALNQPQLPGMAWAQPFHQTLVGNLEAIVARELRGWATLPDSANYLLKTIGIDACMRAYFTSEPEVLRPLYAAMAFQEAAHNIRQAIQKLSSSDQKIDDMMNCLGSVTVCDQQLFEEKYRSMNITKTLEGAIVDWKPDGAHVYLNPNSPETEAGKCYTLLAAAKIHLEPRVVKLLNQDQNQLKPRLKYMQLNEATVILQNGLLSLLMSEVDPEGVQKVYLPNIRLMGEMVNAIIKKKGISLVVDTMLRTPKAIKLSDDEQFDRLNRLLALIDRLVPTFNARVEKVNKEMMKLQAA